MTETEQAAQALQKTVQQISSSQMSTQQLEDALQDAHRLIISINATAQAVEDEDLIKFSREMASLLQTLVQYAPATTPEMVKNLPAPHALLMQLNSAYKDYLEPAYAKFKQVSPNVNLVELEAIAALGAQVFETTQEVNKYRDQFDTREKVYAMCGTVLMVAGVGLLAAAVLNPALGIPTVAALTIVTLGCYLCQKAVARHQNAQSLHESLYKQSELIDSAAKAIKIKYPRPMLKFTPADVSEDKENEPSPKFGQELMAKLKKSARKLWGKD